MEVLKVNCMLLHSPGLNPWPHAGSDSELNKCHSTNWGQKGFMNGAIDDWVEISDKVLKDQPALAACTKKGIRTQRPRTFLLAPCVKIGLAWLGESTEAIASWCSTGKWTKAGMKRSGASGLFFRKQKISRTYTGSAVVFWFPDFTGCYQEGLMLLNIISSMPKNNPEHWVWPEAHTQEFGVWLI